MKWCIHAIGLSFIGFVLLYAILEQDRSNRDVMTASSDEASGSFGHSTAANSSDLAEVVSVEPIVSVISRREPRTGPAFEAQIEKEILEPLRSRRERSLRAAFSRARISRDRVRFDFTRADVPEVWADQCDGVIAIERGEVKTRALLFRLGSSRGEIEVRVADRWHPAKSWIENARNSFDSAPIWVGPIRRTRRTGEVFETAVIAELLQPLEERQKIQLQGLLSRSAPSRSVYFDFTRLDSIPEDEASRFDGALEITSIRTLEPAIVPFREETEGGTVEVYFDERWQTAKKWATQFDPALHLRKKIGAVPEFSPDTVPRDS